MEKKILTAHEIRQLELQQDWNTLIAYFDTPLRRFLRKWFGLRFTYELATSDMYNHLMLVVQFMLLIQILVVVIILGK